MPINTDSKKIKELLTRGTEEVISEEDLEQQLKSGKRLRIKLGIDPTSPNIHIGRAIPLLKLRDFQELGHKIVLIIGDFTGVIGDTSDKDSERPMLSEKEVKENLKNYIEQAGKIINIKKCEIHYNSEWLEKLKYNEIGRQADVFSLNEFIARENIKKRLNAGKRVSLRELLYPLMQGYDSVAVKADVEIGGTDQKFNLLAGRELQRYYEQKPQNILTNPLIEGLDGRKMSSSWGNTINLFDSPKEMFGKIMSLKDELIIKYLVLTTRLELAEIEKYKKELEKGGNPRDYKMKLGFEIVKFYHSNNEAEEAKNYFIKTFTAKETPIDIKEINFTDELTAFAAIKLYFGEKKSNSEIKRLLRQRAISKNGKKITDLNVKVKKGDVFKIGRLDWFKII